MREEASFEESGVSMGCLFPLGHPSETHVPWRWDTPEFVENLALEFRRLSTG